MTSLSDISKRLGVDLNILSAIDKARLACDFKVPSLKDVRMLVLVLYKKVPSLIPEFVTII